MIGAYIMKELMAYIYGVKGKKVWEGCLNDYPIFIWIGPYQIILGKIYKFPCSMHITNVKQLQGCGCQY